MSGFNPLEYKSIQKVSLSYYDNKTISGKGIVFIISQFTSCIVDNISVSGDNSTILFFNKSLAFSNNSSTTGSVAVIYLY